MVTYFSSFQISLSSFRIDSLWIRIGPKYQQSSHETHQMIHFGIQISIVTIGNKDKITRSRHLQ
jgi:hypothetical protein